MVTTLRLNLMALLITATWYVYGISEMIRSCAETASSSSFAEDTSTDFAVAFLISPIKSCALDKVRHAAVSCTIGTDRL